MFTPARMRTVEMSSVEYKGPPSPHSAFIVHKYATPHHHPPHSLVLPHHIYNTVYLSAFVRGKQSRPHLSMAATHAVQKQEGRQEKGLTSSIPPSPAFSNLVVFSLPFYLLSGCTYVRPSFGKAQSVWKHGQQQLTMSKDR